jgi:hypothetical protein
VILHLLSAKTTVSMSLMMALRNALAKLKLMPFNVNLKTFDSSSTLVICGFIFFLYNIAILIYDKGKETHGFLLILPFNPSF